MFYTYNAVPSMGTMIPVRSMVCGMSWPFSLRNNKVLEPGAHDRHAHGQERIVCYKIENLENAKSPYHLELLEVDLLSTSHWGGRGT